MPTAILSIGYYCVHFTVEKIFHVKRLAAFPQASQPVSGKAEPVTAFVSVLFCLNLGKGPAPNLLCHEPGREKLPCLQEVLTCHMVPLGS